MKGWELLMADIQVINRVFNLLGRDHQGSALSDEWGQIVSDTVDAKLKIILESSTWSFTIGFEELARNTSIENPGFSYQYPVPVNCVSVLEAYSPYNDGTEIKIGYPMMNDSYEISDSLVFTDALRCLVKYKKGTIIAAQQQQSFIDALAYLSASELAVNLLENSGLAKNYFETYLYYKSVARKNDIKPGRQRKWKVRRRAY